MQPIKILFTIPNFITAGSGRAMLNIVEKLDRNVFAPEVCVLKKGGGLDRYVEKLGLPFHEAPFTVPAHPKWTFFTRAAKAARYFRPLRFQLWHSFHYSDDFSEPVIAYFAGASSWIYTKKNMSWYQRTWYLRSLLASRIAAQNHDMLKHFFKHPLFRKKVSVIPTSVDMDTYHPDVPPRLNLRATHKIPDYAVLVGCVAQLVPVKGHPQLLEAIAKIPNFHVVLAGAPLDPKYVEGLRNIVTNLKIEDRVHFLGLVQDIPALLSEIDIFVLPSGIKGRAEGCPVALLEAMSSGKACVATDIPGSRDILKGCYGGWIVPPENPDALAEALTELGASRELREKIGREAREKIFREYRIEREVEQYVSLYDSIIDGKRSV
jgi:glycosyltransferase involved in cell wall biosynthesis